MHCTEGGEFDYPGAGGHSLFPPATFRAQHTPLQHATAIPGCKKLGVLNLSKAFQEYNSVLK